jgi:hypothetical protein
MSARDEAALQNAQTLSAQPSFLILFAVAAVAAVVGVISVVISSWGVPFAESQAHLDEWGGTCAEHLGIVVFVVLAALIAIGYFTGQGEAIMMGSAMILALISGVVSLTALIYVATGAAPSAEDVYGGDGDATTHESAPAPAAE